MNLKKPRILYTDNKYCPGCGHGIVGRLIAEVLEESGDDRIALAAIAVGCCSLMPDTYGVDCVQAQHGRAAAVACGMKRVRPQNLVFTYQGDGDALAIGFSETMWSAIRNENITVFFVNNGNFAMTGGQLAPTTLEHQVTTTSPQGRNCDETGRPLDVIRLMSCLNVGYLARVSVSSPANIQKAKRCIRSALECQKKQRGFSFVEILSPCPTNWKLSPLASMQRIDQVVTATYPLCEYKKWEESHV